MTKPLNAKINTYARPGPDGDVYPIACWCGADIVFVPKEDLGHSTGTCARRGCDERVIR